MSWDKGKPTIRYIHTAKTYQVVHQCSSVRLSVIYIKKFWVLQRARADLSLRWAPLSCWRSCCVAAHIPFELSHYLQNGKDKLLQVLLYQIRLSSFSILEMPLESVQKLLSFHFVLLNVMNLSSDPYTRR